MIRDVKKDKLWGRVGISRGSTNSHNNAPKIHQTLILKIDSFIPEEIAMKQLTPSDIKEFLENAPLYVWQEFEKPVSWRESEEPVILTHLVSPWVREIDAFCEKCGQPRPFQDLTSRGVALAPAPVALAPAPVLQTGTSCVGLTCVSCKESKREYHVELVVDIETIRIQKYGELPKKQLERNPVLQRFLEDDLENYEKAVVCLSHEYGVAAFAYFRRIVENNINKLLDLVQEDTQSSSANTEVASALVELKKDPPMSKKIKIANYALPEHLNPDGLNPLGRLYQVLSEGVHNFSEEECLNKAKITSECLVYLVSELASRKKHRTQFKSVIEGL